MRTKAAKRRVVKVSLVTEVHSKAIGLFGFSRPCGSNLPVLEASNTTVSNFHASILIQTIYGDIFSNFRLLIIAISRSLTYLLI